MDCDSDGRKLCPFCDQLLAPAAYYRHVNESVWPKKPETPDHAQRYAEYDSDSSVSLSSVEVGEPMDSSFSFDTSEDEEYLSSSQCEFTELGNCTDSLGDDDTSCTDTFSLVSGEEIWENSSDDDVGQLSRSEPTSIKANRILYAISFFLSFFQLTFRVSERAMAALLTFLRVLLSYVSSLSQNEVLIRLSSLIPKSLFSMRKFFKDRDGLCEYVVCPKCHALYEISQCIVKVGVSSQSFVTLLSFLDTHTPQGDQSVIDEVGSESWEIKVSSSQNLCLSKCNCWNSEIIG